MTWPRTTSPTSTSREPLPSALRLPAFSTSRAAHVPSSLTALIWMCVRVDSFLFRLCFFSSFRVFEIEPTSQVSVVVADNTGACGVYGLIAASSDTTQYSFIEVQGLRCRLYCNINYYSSVFVGIISWYFWWMRNLVHIPPCAWNSTISLTPCRWQTVTLGSKRTLLSYLVRQPVLAGPIPAVWCVGLMGLM